MAMKARIVALPVLLGLALLMVAPAAAQQPSTLTIYYYQDGQAVPISRSGILSGDPQADAGTLLAALLAGPTPAERTGRLVSPLPPDAELAAVTVAGDEVTIDLRLPLRFLREELDAYRSDAIVEQIVKTLHPLGLNRVHVRAEGENGQLLPVSSFLPRRVVAPPEIPANSEPLPDRAGPAPDYVGQPPLPGQGQPQGALSGKTVWLSAGHGWYWSDTLNRWNTQRPNCYGIVEDFANAEAVNYYLAHYLWNAGADVWLVREPGMTADEVIVDNDDGAPAYTETGTWTTSGTPGYGGGTYRWASTFSTLSATATWTPDLPAAGWYPVWAWYRHGTNRPTDARYEIQHAGGVTTVRISQEVHGQTWRYLGEYYFEAGTAGHVTLLNASDDPGQAIIADAVRFGAGPGSIAEPGGTSGEPRWEEAAMYWAHYQGAPEAVYGDDVTARPLYAEWESAKGYPGEAENAVYVSWHTNAGGGTGTESYIHDTEPTTGSVELQDWIHAELIHDLKAAWNPAWVNRGQKTADFGELRELSSIPGVLLEVAFHDTENPGDADDLREPLFRQIAARAVFQGIVKYYAARQGTPPTLLPEPPQRLAARNSAPGEVTLTWAPPPCCDGTVGDAATAYKVYHSSDGRGFDDGVETISPTLTLSGLAPGSLHFFRVTALNAGGESFPTAVVAVRTPETGQPVDFLIVDGFDRLDQSALIPQWESPALGTARRMFLERMNRYDYAVEHGQSLAACGLAFDGAVNEAVTAGDVSLAGYAAVDWFTGEDSAAAAAADAALDDAERALLAGYLDGSGRLLISGAEIGYDLVENGRDPAFYHDYLCADYRGDDAGTYEFGGVPGGPFKGLSGSFDDGSGPTYDVGYPDRLGATIRSTVVLTYAGGTADGAAVACAGDFRVVHFGFPLETVTDPVTRTALFCAAAGYLLPAVESGVALFPDHSTMALPGAVLVYTHTLVNQGTITATVDITHTSSQSWTVAYSSPITLESGVSTTLAVRISVPSDVPNGTVDVSVLTATVQGDPTAWAAVADTITVYCPEPLPSICTPRLINPGFEGGSEQSAWQGSVPGSDPLLAHRDDLPATVQPFGGDWLAWFRPAITGTKALTQAVALPSGEPAVTLSLAWLVQPDLDRSSLQDWTGLEAPDTLSGGIYDMSGTLQTDLFTVTNHSPTGTWQTAEFDLGAFAGQTVQLGFRAVSSATDFFVDDVALTTCGPPGPPEFRALWVDAYHDGIKTPQQIDELVETARAGNFNALIVQVRRRGDTYYPSAFDPWAADADPTFDALAYLIDKAHAAGIEVHAWAAVLALWNGDTPPTAPGHAFNLHGPGATGDDYWLMTTYAGEEALGDQAYYLDPGHPGVVDYTMAVLSELVSDYDLDGLHLDHIRYPDAKGAYCSAGQPWYCQDWGYNPTALARFQAQTGRSDVPDPLDEQWSQWRRDQVTALVRRIYLTVTAIKPRLRVSAAVSAMGDAPVDEVGWSQSTPYLRQLQDWRAWLVEGILDLALPMTYRDEDTSATQFDGWIEWEKDHQYGRGVVVGTGLYLNAVEDSMDQWRRVRQASGAGNRALGLAGYSYATPSDEGTSRRAFVNAAVTAVFTQAASPPPIPWKDEPVLGHLMGTVTQTPPCLAVDGFALALSGPQTRTLLADGSGWFGAVDLLPGPYLLSAEIPISDVTVDVSVTVLAGTVTEQPIRLPACWSNNVYLPLILR
jgi:uncharacterized lipoprotein YddW (UPF0748 family)